MERMGPVKKIITLSIPLFLFLAIFGAIYLTHSSQDLRSRAAEHPDPEPVVSVTWKIPIDQQYPNSINWVLTDVVPLMNNANIKSIQVGEYPYNGGGGCTFSDNSMFFPAWNQSNVGIIVHEIGHTIYNTEEYYYQLDGTLPTIDKFILATGWQPDPDSSGTGWIPPANLPTTYSGESPEEHFSESLKLYVTDNENFKKEFPVEYGIISKVFNGQVPKPQSRTWQSYFAFNQFISQVYAVDKPDLISHYDRIIPGVTTKAEVINELGDPVETFDRENKTIFWYPSLNSIYHNTVIFINDIVSVVTVFQDLINPENNSSYGAADRIMSSNYRSSSKTLFFDKEGLAVIANEDGTVLVKQKYLPQKTQEFISSYQAEFPPEEPTVTPSVTPFDISTPTPTPETQTVCTRRNIGNANCDGNISGRDYVIWMLTQCNPEGTQTCSDIRADFNGDNKVNNDDYDIWFAHRGN